MDLLLTPILVSATVASIVYSCASSPVDCQLFTYYCVSTQFVKFLIQTRSNRLGLVRIEFIWSLSIFLNFGGSLIVISNLTFHSIHFCFSFSLDKMRRARNLVYIPYFIYSTFFLSDFYFILLTFLWPILTFIFSFMTFL